MSESFSYLASVGTLMREYATKRLMEIRSEAAALEAFLGHEVSEASREVSRRPGLRGAIERVLEQADHELRVREITQRLASDGFEFNNPARATLAVQRALEGLPNVVRRKTGQQRSSAAFYSLPKTAGNGGA